MYHTRSVNHCIWLVVGNWLCMFVPPKNGIMTTTKTGSHWSKIVLTNHKRFAGHGHRSTAPRNPEPMVKKPYGYLISDGSSCPAVPVLSQNVLPGSHRSHRSHRNPGPDAAGKKRGIGIRMWVAASWRWAIRTSTCLWRPRTRSTRPRRNWGDVAIWYIYIWYIYIYEYIYIWYIWYIYMIYIYMGIYL